MTKIERLKARHEAEIRRERAMLKALKIAPFALFGYASLWLLLAM